MTIGDIREYLTLLSTVECSPGRHLWLLYDREADVLYVNFKKPSIATDPEFTDDVIIRYEGEKVIGLTILYAGKGQRPETQRCTAG